MSVDGTDFRIQEQTPFWGGWCSHKYNGPAVRYEMGVCIQTSHIVWTNGPFAAGRCHDITIFRKTLKKLLRPWERVEADLGYSGDERVHGPDDHAPNMRQYIIKYQLRDRHETINKLLKEFGCLQHRFRHDVNDHGMFFSAVAVIVQITIARGERVPFKINYKTM